MPCQSDYLERSKRETESADVLLFLLETGHKVGDFHDYYGRVATLNEDTAKLCAWCKKNDVSKQSLELQIWWRDHQLADAKRAEAKFEAERQFHFKQKALAKLTPEERKILGL